MWLIMLIIHVDCVYHDVVYHVIIHVDCVYLDVVYHVNNTCGLCIP